MGALVFHGTGLIALFSFLVWIQSGERWLIMLLFIVWWHDRDWPRIYLWKVFRQPSLTGCITGLEEPQLGFHSLHLQFYYTGTLSFTVIMRVMLLFTILSSISLLITPWEWHRSPKVDGQSSRCCHPGDDDFWQTVLLHSSANPNCKFRYVPFFGMAAHHSWFGYVCFFQTSHRSLSCSTRSCIFSTGSQEIHCAVTWFPN